MGRRRAREPATDTAVGNTPDTRRASSAVMIGA
jgi:hypothetical protein